MSRYRVSNVEAFRQFELDEEAELSDLIARIKGRDAPSPNMAAGTAFHKAMELASDDVFADQLEVDGYTFRFTSEMQIALPVVRELRASKTYIVDGSPIVISGQVDAIDGLRIEDHKTTGRFDPERYIAGCQWQLYLDIFGAEHFRWNVFEIGETDDPLMWTVFAHHTLEQFRYPSLESDCLALVTRFARFVREHVEVAA